MPVARKKDQPEVKKPWEVIDEEIHPHLSVECLFGDLRRLQRDGRFWQASCPLHGDEQGAFSIDPERLEWNCFLGCGGGGPVQYLQRVRRLSWIDAARELALLAEVEPSILDPWLEYWTEEDFLLHDKVESRSSLLSLFIAYARAVFRSPAGDTLRAVLIRRWGFRPSILEQLDFGLYTAPEDVWHYLKRTGRRMDELRAWGLFDPKWTGRLLAPWKDLHGRTLNVWGWQPFESPKRPAAEESLLFEQKDMLDGRSVPFGLDHAERAGKRKLMLLKSPAESLLIRSFGLDDPFPIAAGGELNAAQLETLQEYLRLEGELTVCWDSPVRHGRKQAVPPTLDRLRSANFPVYLIESARLVDPTRAKGSVSLLELLRRQGGGDSVLKSLEKLLHEREAQVVIQDGSEHNGENWPEVLGAFQGSDSRRSVRLPGLETILRAAEEVGKRLAAGFLRALPAGLAQNLGDRPHALPEQGGAPAAEEWPALLNQPVEKPLPFSVERLEEQTRLFSLGQRSGWRALDDLEVSFCPGELVLVGGRPGQGKTSFLLSLLLQWLSGREGSFSGKESGFFLFYSLEETEMRVYHRLISLLTSREGWGWSIAEVEEQLRRPGNGSSHAGPRLEAFLKARRKLQEWENSLQIVCRPHWRIHQLESHVRATIQEQRVTVVVIDPVQSLAFPNGKRQIGMRSEVARRLKSLAVETFCPIVASSLMRIRPEVDSAPGLSECRPQLADVTPRGLIQEADVILGLFNHDTTLEIGTLKNRYGPTGRWASFQLDERLRYIVNSSINSPAS